MKVVHKNIKYIPQTSPDSGNIPVLQEIEVDGANGYWSAAVSSCQGDARALWSKLRPLLWPGSNATSQLTANDYVQLFTTKIDRIRASTVTAPYPILEERHVTDPLSAFEPETAEEILKILNRSAAKQCQLDPVPTQLVKRTSGILDPIIANMCNALFQQGKLSVSSEKAIVRPLLKKQTLDQNDPSSYRPISDLSFVSKIVERVVDASLSKQTAKHNLIPVFQSAYRPFHSTETAVACVPVVVTYNQGCIKITEKNRQNHGGFLKK